jgi:hypothetical protein
MTDDIVLVVVGDVTVVEVSFTVRKKDHCHVPATNIKEMYQQILHSVSQAASRRSA